MASFNHWFAGLFPGVHAAGKIVEELETHLAHPFSGFGAAHAARAVQNARHSLVQRRDLLLKVGRADVNVDRARHVASGKFLLPGLGH